MLNKKESAAITKSQHKLVRCKQTTLRRIQMAETIVVMGCYEVEDFECMENWPPRENGENQFK